MPTKICEESDIVAFPVDGVWSIVSDFGGIGKWMPAVTGVKVEGEGVGAIRTVSGGPTPIEERLESYDAEQHSFSYRVLNIPGLPIRGYINLKPIDNNTTQMTYGYDIEEIDEGLRQMIAVQSTALIKASIARLKEVLQ